MKTSFALIGMVLLVSASQLCGQSPGRGRGADFQSVPEAKDDFEKKVLAVLDEMAGRSRGMMSVPRDDGRLIRMLVESIGAKQAVELGTSHGYSGIWTALALHRTGGKLTTYEIDDGRAKLARENFKKAGVEDIITLVFGDAHENIKQQKGPVDFVFVDADKEGYLDYLEKLMPLLRPGALVLAHNINSRMADPKFIKAITSNPELETLFIPQGDGISLTMKKR